MSLKLVTVSLVASLLTVSSVGVHAAGRRPGPLGAASHSRVLYSSKDVTLNGQPVPAAATIAKDANGGRVSPIDQPPISNQITISTQK